MGGCSYLVIGPDVEEQMAPYRFFQSHVDRHVKSIDILQKCKRQYAEHSDPNGSRRVTISFVEWVNKYYQFRNLLPGQSPNLYEEDQHGWMRIDSNGEIIELIERNIPGGFWLFWEVIVDYWQLKPGASGVSSGYLNRNESAGFSGSALKGSIDWNKIRADATREAGERWDAAAKGITLPYSEIFYHESENKRITYPRDQYIQAITDLQIGNHDLIMNGHFYKERLNSQKTGLAKTDEWCRYLNELIDQLPDDTLITAVYCEE